MDPSTTLHTFMLDSGLASPYPNLEWPLVWNDVRPGEKLMVQVHGVKVLQPRAIGRNSIFRQTLPSVQVVRLVGSWDNFSLPYTMERDIRRDPGQWRGCHSFKSIILDGDNCNTQKRDGGLKMGQTYYYYYELDGSIETHDPSLPSTTACPYLPGQAVNTLWVPVEQSLRRRSASMNSLRNDDLKTMNPQDRFVSPRPAPSPPPTSAGRRLPTASAATATSLERKSSSRSLSPSTNWMLSTRKIFGRKASSSSLRDVTSHPAVDDDRSIRSWNSDHANDPSLESLRRFLAADLPTQGHAENKSAVIIEDDAEVAADDLDNDDDDNFASLAAPEPAPFTGLSPPPSQRSNSPALSTASLEPKRTYHDATVRPLPAIARLRPELRITAPESRFSIPHSRFSASDTSARSSSDLADSPESVSAPSFYHSETDDEDLDDNAPLPTYRHIAGQDQTASDILKATLSTYSLPPSSSAGTKRASPTQPSVAAGGSPALLARNGSDMPLGTTSLLADSIPNSGLDDLINELSWMADVLTTKST